jgi:putative addiction module component (TIGR02574 family)
MNKTLMSELEKLDPEERVRLAYDLLDSVANEMAVEPVTEAQRELMRRRLSEYHANPNEPVAVATLADIKRDLGLF